MTSERRQFQRLRLMKPILGLMNGESALILDIGIAGAFIEHYGTPEPGARFDLTFRWQGHDIGFACEVARTQTVHGQTGDEESIASHTGARFLSAVGDSDKKLQEMIGSFVGRILEAQKANANGDAAGEAILAQLGEARRARARGFVTYELNGSEWCRIPSSSPVQPLEGFTVPAYEEDEDVEKLCRAYEDSDEDGRNLIRIVAELGSRGARA